MVKTKTQASELPPTPQKLQRSMKSRSLPQLIFIDDKVYSSWARKGINQQHPVASKRHCILVQFHDCRALPMNSQICSCRSCQVFGQHIILVNLVTTEWQHQMPKTHPVLERLLCSRPLQLHYDLALTM